MRVTMQRWRGPTPTFYALLASGWFRDRVDQSTQVACRFRGWLIRASDVSLAGGAPLGVLTGDSVERFRAIGRGFPQRHPEKARCIVTFDSSVARP